MCFFFFFQAEDGIRDKLVTGVQTCALPIAAQASATAKAARDSRDANGNDSYAGRIEISQSVQRPATVSEIREVQLQVGVGTQRPSQTSRIDPQARDAIASVSALRVLSQVATIAAAHVLAASAWAAAMVATWLTTRSADTLAIASLAWGSILLVWLGRWVPTPTWSWTSRISLTMAGLWALSLISMRPPYEFLPFTTRESVAAFAVALAWA